MSKRHQHSVFVSLDDLVPKDHPYRYLHQILHFTELSVPYQNLYSIRGPKEKGVEFSLRALVLQCGSYKLLELNSSTPSLDEKNRLAK